MTRLRTSRPNSSVPIRCARLGGCRSTRKSCLVGLYGLIWPAKNAEAITRIKTSAPATPVRERRKRRRAAPQGVVERRTDAALAARPGWAGRLSGSDETATSGVANARIERGVQHVYQQIDRDDENSDDQHRPLNDRVVARRNGRHDVATDA